MVPGGFLHISGRAQSFGWLLLPKEAVQPLANVVRHYACYDSLDEGIEFQD